ncbi:hypothetical protein [Streptomyces spiralis]|uniref:hypothetical protein n=1 Tax=Streptomyces spiralis TaxID=66376 RepID=UPI00367F9493
MAFDGRPGALPPPGRLDAWPVTDEHSELRSALRRHAAERNLPPGTRRDVDLDGLRVRCRPVVHTSHPADGYRIEADGLLAVRAPEFLAFPAWAAGADLMFAEAAAWNRPILFRGGVGGHATVQTGAEEAARHGVRRLVYAHIGRSPPERPTPARDLRPRVGRRGPYIRPPSSSTSELTGCRTTQCPSAPVTH